MKVITNSTKKEVKLKDIKDGECFIDKSLDMDDYKSCCIKTQKRDDDDDILIVNFHDGYAGYESRDIKVIPINAVVNAKGKE